jgi:microcystin-dependent protein
MGQPYVGEIRMFGGSFAPVGWALCNGALMPIAQFDTLYALLGTTYGGDGQTTFGLPDLQGRVPVHQGTQQGTGTTYVMGERAGVESVTLTTNQMPVHNHAIFSASGSGGAVAVPANNTVLSDENLNPTPNPVPFAYLTNGGTATTLATQSLTQVGGSQPHDNMQPFLTITYIISLFGLFPSQN